VYYALPAFLERPDNLAGRFTKALTRALRWISEHDPTEASGIFERHFAAYRPELIASTIRTSRAEGVWTETARLDATALDGWQDILMEAGLIDRKYAYEDVFDSRHVEWAERELARQGPSL
jgi:NitT/TauT family transport system substrate-binding protein